MATHSDDSSQYSNKGLQIRLQRMKKERYMQVHFVQGVYTCGLTEKKERIMYTHTFTRGKECTCWKTKFFVRGIWSKVFDPRYWSKVFGSRY